MKKTFTINIRGSVFHIEEDAYEILHKYMLTIKEHFNNVEDGQEIISDIEFRLSELFTQKGENISLITLEKVNDVISIMGLPEDFDEEKQVKIKKRLYRDPEQKVIAGVCGGLAAYFNIDVAIVRIITVLLFFLTGVVGIIYILMWIIVPKAVTSTQKLEMRGKNVTIKNIEKFFNETMEKIKK